jgi:hypothetical protein
MCDLETLKNINLKFKKIKIFLKILLKDRKKHSLPPYMHHFS